MITDLAEAHRNTAALVQMAAEATTDSAVRSVQLWDSLSEAERLSVVALLAGGLAGYMGPCARHALVHAEEWLSQRG